MRGVLKKNKILLFLTLLLIYIYPQIVLAQELPSGMVIGDDKGISATRNGEYLVEVNDVMPGKKWNTTISFLNLEKDVPYKLSMIISPPEVQGILDLSKAIHMEITYEDKVVYKGPVSGISEEKNLQSTPLELGIFNSGDSRAMEVDFSISGEYTNKDFSQKNIMENTWIFNAVKEKNNESGLDSKNEKKYYPVGNLPKTGEDWRQFILNTCLGLFLLLIVLLFWKSKRDKDEKF